MTEKQFRKKLIIRIIIGTLFFVTGFTPLLLYIILRGRLYMPYVPFDNVKSTVEVLSSLYKTYFFIFVLPCIGLFISIKNLIVLKNQNLFKKRYVAENDERNKQISLRAMSWTTYVGIYSVFVTAFFAPSVVIKYLMILVCVPLAVFCIVYTVLRKKM